MTIALLGVHRMVDVFDYSTTQKPVVGGVGMSAFAVQRFPTDPIGVFTLTLTNVVPGSRVHVEKQSDGTEYYDAVAASSAVTVNLNTYAAGSPGNDLRIKVRKGTGSPTYKPFETLATAIVGSQSIYVGQITDE